MREIKFRGKVKTKKSVEMNGYTLVPDTWLTTDLIAGGDHQGVMVEKIHEFWHLVDDGWIDENTVGQWTGLKDSKGVEIYEGDVIVGRDANRCNSDLYEPTPVIWREGSFCCEYWHMPIDSRCEVCGTIHDKENNNDQS